MGLLDFFKRKRREVSPGGSTVYRYGEPEGADKLHLPDQVGLYAGAVEAHFTRLFPGRRHRSCRDFLDDYVQVTLHVLDPTPAQPFYVVFTTGMSDLPMALPPQVVKSAKADLSRAELYLFLPGDWPLDREVADLPASAFWPLATLLFLARFPHRYKTWLSYGHSVPNGEDYAPMDDSVGFGGVVLDWSREELISLTAEGGQQIMLYQVVPCYKEEIEYKLKYGMDELHQRFYDHGALGPLDPKRPNLCQDFREVLD